MFFIVYSINFKKEKIMTTFKDFENEIKSFENRLNFDEQNLYVEFIKTLDFDFLKNQDPINFIDNLIINDTLIEKVNNSKYEEPDDTFLVKYKNLKLKKAF